MRMTARARRQYEQYKDKPNKIGFRKRILAKEGYSGTKNDGFCDALNSNKFKWSRIHKETNNPKTPGRKPGWMELLD